MLHIKARGVVFNPNVFTASYVLGKGLAFVSSDGSELYVHFDVHEEAAEAHRRLARILGSEANCLFDLDQDYKILDVYMDKITPSGLRRLGG